MTNLLSIITFLPIVAAVGGMIVPALIYAAFNVGTEGSRGWGIPMATDIAFAIGIVRLGRRRHAPPQQQTNRRQHNQTFHRTPHIQHSARPSDPDQTQSVCVMNCNMESAVEMTFEFIS